MDKSIKVLYDGKSFDFDLLKGSENELGINIKRFKIENGFNNSRSWI